MPRLEVNTSASGDGFRAANSLVRQTATAANPPTVLGSQLHTDCFRLTTGLRLQLLSILGLRFLPPQFAADCRVRVSRKASSLRFNPLRLTAGCRVALSASRPLPDHFCLAFHRSGSINNGPRMPVHPSQPQPAESMIAAKPALGPWTGTCAIESTVRARA